MEYFFTLMRYYADHGHSLAQVWEVRDTEEVFESIHTLYRYRKSLMRQLDAILAALSRELAMVDGTVVLPDLNPGEDSSLHKLRLLFVLLDMLIDILHEKNRHSILLLEERHSFLHYYLYQKCGIELLDSS